MTIRTITVRSFTIDDHPEEEKVFEWINNNWFDLGQHHVDEAIESLKAFAKKLEMEVDYSIGIVEDRSSHITFKWIGRMGDAKTGDRLTKQLEESFGIDEEFLSGNCPMTGVVYDEVLLDAIRKRDQEQMRIDICNDAGKRLQESLVKEGEHIYSNDGLRELCVANEYFFLEDGSCQ